MDTSKVYVNDAGKQRLMTDREKEMRDLFKERRAKGDSRRAAIRAVKRRFNVEFE